MPASPAATDVFRVRVDVRVSPDAAWIHASGDIDLAAAPRLHTAIDEALEHDLPVWLDLSGVTFVDSSCVHEVLRVQQLAFAQGTCLLIVPPSGPHLMKPFDLLGRSPPAFRSSTPPERPRPGGTCAACRGWTAARRGTTCGPRTARSRADAKAVDVALATP